MKNPTAEGCSEVLRAKEGRRGSDCISTIHVCRYVGERDTQIFHSDVQGIVDREGFVIQALDYAL